jgi:hypothetical protein
LKPNIPDLVVNLLALMAIAIFVHDEVRRAAALSHTAAIVTGLLPHFFAANGTVPQTAQQCTAHLRSVHWLFNIIMLSAPVLQLITALLVLLTASMLSIKPETASSIQVVINSFALGFILEVDNRIGQLPAAQHEHWAAAHAPENSMARSNAAKGSVVDGIACSCFTKRMGHAYFAVIGLLLCLEPVSLTPHAAVAVFAIVTGSVTDMFVDPVRFSQVVPGLDRAWSVFLGMRFTQDMAFDDGVVVRVLKTNAATAVVHALLLVAIVLLLFYKPLPSAARRWPHVLLTLQALTAVCVATYTLVPLLWMHLLPIGMVFVTWLCMFIVWPICHKDNPKHPGPRCCCHGNCESCCTICCSSGFGPAFGARCGVYCGVCCAATC